MSVNAKMTAIADEIRILSGTTSKIGLDVIKNLLNDANTEIDIQTDLITQILTAMGGVFVDGDVTGSPIEVNTVALRSILNMAGPSTPSMYAKARRLDITLPASGWSQDGQVLYNNITDSEDDTVKDSYTNIVEGASVYDSTNASDDGIFIQRVAADVTASDQPFVQCILSSDYDTVCDELHRFNLIAKIETFDGYIVATYQNDSGDCEAPDSDITISLIIVDGVSKATISKLWCVDSKQITVDVPASGWILNNGIYTQTVDADVRATNILFGDGMFSMNMSTATNELNQQTRIDDLIPGDGTLTFVSYDIDGYGPPEVDLTVLLKVFERKTS